MASLSSWVPSDSHAVPLVELLSRAEGEVCGVLREELRGDGLPLDEPGDRAAGQFDVEAAGPLGGPFAEDGQRDLRVADSLLVVRQLPALARGRLHEASEGEQARCGHRLDSITSALDRVRSVMSRLLGDSTIHRVVSDTGERARAASERQWAEAVSRELGRDVALDQQAGRERLQAWIAENTARIQGLRNATLEQVRADLETAVLSQVRPSELAAHWERVGLPTRNGTLRGRALVIARDQLGTLASQLAQHQQTALGIEEYDWDATLHIVRKHRKVHLGRHGARYRWDSPPPNGHPGRPVCCCCGARPVLDRAALKSRFGVR